MPRDPLDHVSPLFQVRVDGGERALKSLMISLVVAEKRVELAASICLCGSGREALPP